MGKSLEPEVIKVFEAEVVPEKLRGKQEWPIEVRVLDEVAYLRLIRNRKRICFDWRVPKRLRSALGQDRLQGAIPKPSPHVPLHEDPGRNPGLAKDWLREWLRKKVLEGEAARERQGWIEPSVPNSIPFPILAEKFRESEKFQAASEHQRDQWELWLDFFRAELGDDFKMYDLDPDVLLRLLRRYQEEWVRVLEDGSERIMKTGAGHNSAAKVIRFLHSLCLWGVSISAGGGKRLLDSDPLGTMRKEDWKRFKERATARRPVGAATDQYAKALLEELKPIGDTGQPFLIYSTEAALGRRPGEVRELKRKNLLTTEAEIADGLRLQSCREALPDRAIPEEEIEEAAAEYFAMGWAIRFDAGKQLAKDPEAAQHDRVVPLGRRLTAVYQEYLEEYWTPLGLGPEAWLCPSATDPSKATDRHTATNWVVRARTRVAERAAPPTPPHGLSHPLRHRFRQSHRREPDKLVAFVGGWTLRRASAMDAHYLGVPWRDILEFMDRIDKTTAAVL